MSDRLALHASKEEVEKTFGVSTHRNDFFEADYNINPGTLMPAVCREEGERKVHRFRWGLIPEGAEEEREGKEHYQAELEDVLGDGRLKECLDTRRCIVPANGFYKWKTSKKKSTPFFIRLLENKVAGLAGIYDVWQSQSTRNVYSFTLLMTEANALVQPVGERMPVILPEESYGKWLADEEWSEAGLQKLIRPFDLTRMAVNRVSEKVNDLSNNGPELIQPIPK